MPLRLGTALWPSCLYLGFCSKLCCPWCPTLNIFRSDGQDGNFQVFSVYIYLKCASPHLPVTVCETSQALLPTRETGSCHFPSFAVGKLRHNKSHCWGLYRKLLFKSSCGSGAEDGALTSARSHFSRQSEYNFKVQNRRLNFSLFFPQQVRAN